MKGTKAKPLGLKKKKKRKRKLRISRIAKPCAAGSKPKKQKPRPRERKKGRRSEQPHPHQRLRIGGRVLVLMMSWCLGRVGVDMLMCTRWRRRVWGKYRGLVQVRFSSLGIGIRRRETGRSVHFSSDSRSESVRSSSVMGDSLTSRYLQVLSGISNEPSSATWSKA